jgi:DNA invertase Pin-like site-specific DNA recombinase
MTPTTNPTVAVLLSRVSTGAQADSGLGLEAQEEAMVAFCEREGLTVASSFTDAGVSGRAPLEERAGLVAALASVVEHRAGVLLVSSMDRVARDPMLLLTVERTLKQSGCRLVSVKGEGTEGDDPASVLMRRLMMAMAEHEASLTSARTKAALKAKKARGERLGRPPKGWSVVEGSLVMNSDWTLVHEALTMRANGAKLKAVAAKLGVSVNSASLLCRRWGSPEAFDAFREDVVSGRVK